MLGPTWRNVSFRVWIGVGMSVAVLPLVVSALLHTMVARSAIDDVQNVAVRQRDQLIPLHQLQADLRSAGEPIDIFLLGGDPAQSFEYRTRREHSETGFVRVTDALKRERDAHALVDGAREDWAVADRIASRMFASASPIEAAELGKRVKTSMAAVVARLDEAAGILTASIDGDHIAAKRSAERADWIAGTAVVISLFSIIGGVGVVSYVLARSLDPLVEGTARVASGEAEHRVDVPASRELRRVAGAFNDLAAQLRESRAALADLARHDCLTGLLNRRALDEMLVDALARHERVDEGVAVVVIDVDFFRRVNDTYGHFAGDEVLRLVSGRLAAAIREIDRAFRFGGEEFAVLLFNADRESAEAAAERIRLAVAAQPITVNDIDIAVTISAGIATTDDSANAEGLLNAADAALYCAKSTGRNRVVWVGAMA